MTGRPPVVVLDAAVVDYGRQRAVGPVSLSVAEGEILALVGPSGCGKSTLLRLLAGLETPAGGSVRAALSPGETGMVFQAPTLLPWARTIDNVALPLSLAGVPRPEALERARQALTEARLEGAENLKPAQLSGGMAMRAALARALVTRPRLLLLDEPFAALDDTVRRDLVEDLHRLWVDRQPAIVLVTHNVEEAVYVAQRVVCLGEEGGRITAEHLVRGDLPRPAAHRNSRTFHDAIEAVVQLRGAAA